MLWHWLLRKESVLLQGQWARRQEAGLKSVSLIWGSLTPLWVRGRGLGCWSTSRAGVVGGFWNLAFHSEDGKGVFLDNRPFASERVPMFRYQFCEGEETLVLAVEINIISSVRASPAWLVLLIRCLWKETQYLVRNRIRPVWVWLASQLVLVVKNPSDNAGDVTDSVWSLGQEDPLEEEMATRSSILAWIIPRTKEPGGLQSIGLQRVEHDWSDLACRHCGYATLLRVKSVFTMAARPCGIGDLGFLWMTICAFPVTHSTPAPGPFACFFLCLEHSPPKYTQSSKPLGFAQTVNCSVAVHCIEF